MFIVTLAHAKLFNEKKNKTLKHFCLTFSFSHTFNFSFVSHTFKLKIPKFLPKTLCLLRGHFTLLNFVFRFCLYSHFALLNFVFRYCLRDHFALLKCILLIYFPDSVPNINNLLTFSFSRNVPNGDAKFNYCWRSHIN